MKMDTRPVQAVTGIHDLMKNVTDLHLVNEQMVAVQNLFNHACVLFDRKRKERTLLLTYHLTISSDFPYLSFKCSNIFYQTLILLPRFVNAAKYRFLFVSFIRR